VFYNNLKSPRGAVVHSGDDLTGGVGGDDELDNEIISVNLDQLSPQADQLVFVLNSYNEQDFAIIPFARIRIYEVTPSKVNSVFRRGITNDQRVL
jgi:tellurium resistance protein TerZ